MRIFLSFAGARRDEAARLALRLVGDGHSVFHDRSSLTEGNEYDRRIRSEIRRSDLVVFLVDEDFLRPGAYTLTELGHAQKRWLHPEGHALVVLAGQVDVQRLPPWLGAVTALPIHGNMAAEVAATVEAIARRKCRLMLLKMCAVASIVALAALLLRPFLPALGTVTVVVEDVTRWRPGYGERGDAFLLRVRVVNGTRGAVQVGDFEAEPRDVRYRMATTFEVDAQPFLTLGPGSPAVASPVITWTRDGHPIAEGGVPSPTEWRLCYAVAATRTCVDWQPWRPSGRFPPPAVAAIEDRKVARRATCLAGSRNGGAWLGVQSPPALIQLDSDGHAGAAIPISGVPVAITGLAPRVGQFYVAATAPDEVLAFQDEGLRQIGKWAIPRIQESPHSRDTPATAPYQIASDGARVWVSTRGSAGSAGILELDTVSGRWHRLAVESFEASEMELVAGGGALWGITSSSPHYLFRLDVVRITQFSGHDIGAVGCLRFLVEVRVDGGLGFACDFVFSRYQTTSDTLNVMPLLPRLPAVYDTFTWDVTALASASLPKRLVLAGLERSVRQGTTTHQDRSVVVSFGSDEQWHELVDLPETRVEQLVLARDDRGFALIRNSQHLSDVLLLRAVGAPPQ